VAAIQVKNVPLELHEAIRRRAAQHGMTIGGYLLMLAQRDLERPSRAEWFEQIARREPIRGLDVVAALHAARAERDAELLDALGD
jgi:hypothetical protein